MNYQFFNNAETSVQDGLTGLCYLNASIKQLGDLPCIVQDNIDKTKVAVICGGGSGHEPGHVGFVGKGILTGAVAGNVFASPSTLQVLQLIRNVTGDRGCLVIIKNYTGDRLNFGMAAEKAKKEGYQVEVVVVADDNSLVDTDTIAGARGLCGALFVEKIAGAMSEQGASLEEIHAMCIEVAKNLGTAGVSISPCVPPGKEPSFILPPNTMEFGIGIHGEPGVLRSSSSNCKATVARLWSYLEDSRGLGVHEGDELAILINNLGGTSELEMSIVTKEVVEYMKLMGYTCRFLSCAAFVTSLAMHGISVSVLRLDKAGQYLSLLAAPTEVSTWKAGVAPVSASSVPLKELPERRHLTKELPERRHLTPSFTAKTSPLFVEILQNICKDLICNAKELDELDRIAGDGDCGSTFKSVLQVLQPKISSLDYSSLKSLLEQLAEIVEREMGGTSGALYTIGLTVASHHCPVDEEITAVSRETVTGALKHAIEAISKYGKAKEGDCTMLDVLWPVLRTLELNHAADTKSLLGVLKVAVDAGVQKTKTLKPRAGRASYIGGETNSIDPGSRAAAIWIESIIKVLYSKSL